MQFLFRSIESLTVGGIAFILRVSTDGSTLTAELDQNPRAITVENIYPVQITFGNTTETVSVGTRQSGSASFAYDGSISQITLSGAAITYGGTDCGTVKTFAWGTKYGSPLPTADFLPDGPERVSTSAVRCDVYAPDGMYPALLGVWANRYSSGAWQVQEALTLEEKYGGNAWHVLVSGFSSGDPIMYSYVIAYYSTAEAALYRQSDYEAVAELQSPVYTVSDNGGYYVPYNLAWTSPVTGCAVQITWGTFLDMNGTFQLQRSVDGGDWTLIYAGVSNSFIDTAGAWSTVAYRVRSRRSYGDYVSEWAEGTATEVGKSNLYVGADGKPAAAKAVYLGMNGQIVSLVPMIHLNA